MKLQIEHCPGEVRVTVQGPEQSAELQAVVALLQSETDRMWLLNESNETVLVSPSGILWAETVEDKVFVYTADAVFRALCSLTALELRWGAVGLFRCGKSTIVNLNAVQRLRSRPGGRIEAILPTGEKILISRRYAPLLREKLQGGQ